MKQDFYPTLAKERIFPEGYVSARSGHSRGSTIDLTLVRLKTENETIAGGITRFDESIDMGVGFDYFGDLAHTAHPAIVGEARLNRRLLCDIMHASGFDNFPSEWWHFTLRDEPFQDTYFDFVIR